MDLVYIPEVLTFGSFRSPQYRDYEQASNRGTTDYGASKISTYQHHRNAQNQRSAQTASSSKDNCHLCKENKRRSLAAYIRGKTRQNSCNEISEEEEEESATGPIEKIETKTDRATTTATTKMCHNT